MARCGVRSWGGAELDRTKNETFEFLDRHLKGPITAARLGEP